jgi:hypothetical protein
VEKEPKWVKGEIVTSYTVYSRCKPNIKQVISVYGFIALLILFIVGYSHIADLFPRVPFEIDVVGALLGIVAVSFLPVFLRKRAAA